jgi:hypothetical protein
MSLTDEQLMSACVEITTFPCPACLGRGSASKPTEAGVERTPCAACDETGREKRWVTLDVLGGLIIRARRVAVAVSEDKPAAADGDDTGAMPAPAGALPEPTPAETLPEPCPVDPTVAAADGG